MKKCRWGILGAAEIARKNWQAINLARNGVVTAVTSRNRERCREFVELCQRESPFSPAPRIVASPEELLKADDIDAVYIPLPTGVRKQAVIAAAEAGKHVLCEKPCAPSAADLQEMIDACRDHGVQFMDGVMYMHGNRLPVLRKALDDPQNVGNIRRICTQFSFCADQQWLDTNIRLDSRLEPQGCLGDLGWYCIRFALWTLDWQMPQRVRGRTLTALHRAGSPEPVPIEFSAELEFADRVTASFYCSFITHHQEWANVSGDRGYVHVNDFVLPYSGGETRFEISNAEFVVDKCDFHMDDHRRVVRVSEPGSSAADAQEVNLFRNFSDIVLRGKIDARWPEWSLKTQQVLDACLESAKHQTAIEIDEPAAAR
jgi:predicted dehydrogenase